MSRIIDIPQVVFEAMGQMLCGFTVLKGWDVLLRNQQIRRNQYTQYTHVEVTSFPEEGPKVLVRSEGLIFGIFPSDSLISLEYSYPKGI